MKQKLIFIFLTTLSLYSLGQNSNISGYVYDAHTHEPIIGAIVSTSDNKVYSATNSYGYYTLRLNNGTNNLKINHISYDAVDTTISLSANKTLNFYLTFDNEIEKVVINSNRFIEDVATGTVNLSVKQAKILPSFGGETDILKTLQLLPGINGGAEGMSGFFVRGGTPDQNLILLDDVPIYGSSHLFGFLSVFNEDAIKSVRIIKDGFPAEYSGRLSSVLDIRMIDGNNDKITGNVSVSLVSSKFMLNGPIIKDKITFLVSFRRSYFGFLLGLYALTQKEEGSSTKLNLNFYDFNTKISAKLSSKDRLFFSFYSGRDKYLTSESNKNYIETSNLKWANSLAAIKWTHTFGNNAFWNNQISYTTYNIENSYYSKNGADSSFLIFNQNYKSNIDNYTFKSVLESSFSNSYKLKTGFDIQRLFYLPGEMNRTISYDTIADNYNSSTSHINSLKSNVFLENKISIGNFIRTNIGLNYSMYFFGGKQFNYFEPRFSMSFIINKKMSIKTSYSVINQDIHLLTNSSIGLPSDIWVPATDKIQPEKSTQATIGYFLLTNNIEFSFNCYYKKMENLIAYLPGSNFFLDTKDWENKILSNGIGDAYGAELYIKKNFGKLQGWVSYSLAWNYRQFDELNNGIKYPFKYDQRHNLNIVATYKINKKLTFSATWSYHSGNAITIPVAVYQSSLYPPNIYEAMQPNLNILVNSMHFYGVSFNSTEVVRYSNRNEFRMPAYHRLDIALTYSFNSKYGKNSIQFGLYNAYNHINPYYLTFSLSQTSSNNVYAFRGTFVVRSLIPIVPLISYSLQF